MADPSESESLLFSSLDLDLGVSISVGMGFPSAFKNKLMGIPRLIFLRVLLSMSASPLIATTRPRSSSTAPPL